MFSVQDVEFQECKGGVGFFEALPRTPPSPPQKKRGRPHFPLLISMSSFFMETLFLF